jgi:GH35 family endo-1,4-beta-xylanase
MKKAIFALVLASLLAGCVSASRQLENPATSTTAPPQPSVTKTATPPASTQTPVPVPTLPGLDGIPAPEEEFITAMVSENYLRVMGLAREQVQIVYREHHAASGESFVVMLDETTGVPLAVYTDEWQKATLKFFGRQVGIVMGTDTAENPNSAEIEVSREFERATIQVGNEWFRVEPEQGKIDASQTRATEAVIRVLKNQAGITDIIGHPIVSIYPDWLIVGNFSQDEMRDIMRKRIEYAIRSHPDIQSWVVVNEPYLDCDCGRANDPFYKSWGNSYDYIVEAYEMARAINPNITLIYNDAANEGISGPHTRMTRMIVEMLHQRGLIDYVGMQMHLNQWSGAINQNGKFNRDAFLREVKFYEQMGVPILITEMTYEPTFAFETKMSPEQFNEHLSDIFGSAVSAAIESGNVHQITFWGLTDKWLEDVNWYMIFDKYARPKQSYYIVLRTLYEGMK